MSSDVRNKLIFVAGSGRSGAVGIGNIIAGNECKSIFEPFDERHVPEFSGLGLRPYLRPTSDYPHWKEVITRLLAGSIKNEWIDRDINCLNPEQYQGKIVVKEIRANGMLGWLDVNFPCRIVYVLRHPCAVIASRMKLKWEAHLDMLLNQVELMQDQLAPFEAMIRNANTEVQKHAVMWCAENVIPLKQLPRFNWITCCYESFLEQPEAECRRLLTSLDLALTEPRQQAILLEFSKVFSSPGQRSRSRWMDFLSTQDKQDVQQILDEFGIDIYGINSEIPLKTVNYDTNTCSSGLVI